MFLVNCLAWVPMCVPQNGSKQALRQEGDVYSKERGAALRQEGNVYAPLGKSIILTFPS